MPTLITAKTLSKAFAELASGEDRGGIARRM